MSAPKTSIHIATFAAWLLIAAAAGAEQSSGLSVNIENSKTIAMQRKVEKLFDAADYERAFFIYRNELVPLGDKYAQYMIGYMYLYGLGIDADLPLASAWYQLASERGTQEFVAERDQLVRRMSSEQIAASNAHYSQLRLKYSDLAVLFAAIRKDHDEIEIKTGTRVNSKTSKLTVIEARSSRSLPGSDYYGSIRKRLRVRLLQLKEAGDFEDLNTNPDTINIRELERRVEERLRSAE